MSNSLTYQSYIEKIVAGEALSSDITSESCNVLSTAEKQSLLDLLAVYSAKRLENTTVVQEMKGSEFDSTLEIPAFLYGQITVVDTNNSAQINEAGTTQYVTDSDNNTIAEVGTTFTWYPVAGKHHKTRTLTIPAGVSVHYLFILA